MASTSQLLAAASAGDRKAFSLLVDAQARRLYGIALKITGDPGVAEDVVQETFLRVVEGTAPLRDARAADAWLGRIAGRLAIDALRSRDVRRRGQARVASMSSLFESGPEEKLIQAEEARLVQSALMSLETETRAAVVLHVIEGNGVREIAECLDTSRSTVTRRIQDGLKTLEKRLRRAGFILPLTISLRQVLRSLPDPSPPESLLQKLATVRDAPRRGSRPADPAPEEREALETPPGRRVPGAFRGRRGAAVAAVLLLAAGVGSWIFYPFGRGPERDEPGESVARLSPPSPPTPGPERASPAPVEVAPAMPAKDGPPELAITGRVLDSQGEPVEGAAVLLYRDFTRGDLKTLIRDWTFIDLLMKALEPPRPLAEGTTDAGGRFSFKVADGEPVLVASFWPRDEATDSGAVRGKTSASMEPLELSLRDSYAVGGRVLDAEGAAVEGATIVPVPWPYVVDGTDLTTYNIDNVLQAYVPRSATSDASGRFHLTGLLHLRVNYYALFVQRAGFCAAQWILPYPPLVDDLEIALEPSRKIQGRVFFTPGDEPAASARIVAMAVDRRAPRWFSIARPDEKGEFSIEAATRGEYKVLAKSPGQIFPRRLFVQPEKVEPPILLDIGRGGTSLRGTVRYADTGLPAAGVPIQCRDWAGALFSAESTTDESGRYEFEGLSWSSKAQIVVKTPGYARKDLAPSCPTEKEPNVTLDIDLVPTYTLTGHVVDGEGNPAGGVMVEAFSIVETTADAAALRWRREALETEPAVTDENGEYEIDDYPPQGKTFLWSYAPDLGEGLAGPVDLGDGEQRIHEVDFMLSGGAKLDFFVTDTSGQPLEEIDTQVLFLGFPGMTEQDWGAMWYAQRTSLDIERCRLYTKIEPGLRGGFTGSDGRAAFDRLLAGPHRVVLSTSTTGTKPDDPYVRLRAILAEPLAVDGSVSFQVALDLGHKLEGRVTDTRGKPLARHRVYATCSAPAVDGLTQVDLEGVAVTDMDGAFALPQLGPGPYAVTVLDMSNWTLRIFERPVPESSAAAVLVAPDTPEGRSKKRSE